MDSNEFLDWLEYLDAVAVGPPTRVEQYLAQIAMEVFRLYSAKLKKRPRIDIKKFILRFVFRDSVSTNVSAMTEEEIKAKKKLISERSRARRAATSGIKIPKSGS